MAVLNNKRKPPIVFQTLLKIHQIQVRPLTSLKIEFYNSQKFVDLTPGRTVRRRPTPGSPTRTATPAAARPFERTRRKRARKTNGPGCWRRRNGSESGWSRWTRRRRKSKTPGKAGTGNGAWRKWKRPNSKMMALLNKTYPNHFWRYFLGLSGRSGGPSVPL